jgi:hypothetical protein
MARAPTIRYRSATRCRPISGPETREVLLKADSVSVVFERTADGKIRVTTSSWDDAKVILPNQVLEAAIIGKQVGLVRVDKPIAYLDIDDTGLVEAGYGPQA